MFEINEAAYEAMRRDIERALAYDSVSLAAELDNRRRVELLGISSEALAREFEMPEPMRREIEALAHSSRIAQLERLNPVQPPSVRSDDVWKHAFKRGRRL